MVSDSPPERDMEWSTAGVEGSYKFLNKVLRIVDECQKPKERINLDLIDKENIVIRKIHQSIKDVTEGIESFRFNVCIAKLYELTNMISKLDPKNLEKVDVITSGFPCQAFSIAGYQKGFEDPRGNLFFETMRFVREIKPKT